MDSGNSLQFYLRSYIPLEGSLCTDEQREITIAQAWMATKSVMGRRLLYMYLIELGEELGGGKKKIPSVAFQPMLHCLLCTYYREN
jgi:hypothetical protein